MTYDHELTLIYVTAGENDIGDPVTNEHRTNVLCDMLSITRSEHYAAAAHGLKPEIVFELNKYDYDGQKIAEFEGVRYIVSRTYKPKRSKGIEDFEKIELICSGLVGK